MKKLLGNMMGLGLILGFATSTAMACSCMTPPSPIEQLENSSSVFIGTVKDVSKTTLKDGPYSYDVKKVSFDVERSFTDNQEGEKSVTTALDSAQCGFEFMEGKKYIVYARYKGENERVSLCSRTNLVENAQGDVKELSKHVFVQEQAAYCKLATDGVNDYANVDGTFVIKTKMAYPKNFMPEWSCKDQVEPHACTLEYMPVCGINGVTYGNKCAAGLVDIAYEGECVNALTQIQQSEYNTLKNTLSKKYVSTVDKFLKKINEKYNNTTEYKKNTALVGFTTKLDRTIDSIVSKYPLGQSYPKKITEIIQALSLMKYELINTVNGDIYDQDSRKEVLSSTCKSFNDGCNTCSRGKDGQIACTRMYCEKYNKPTCLDNTYDSSSWEHIIPETCKSFNDGCNSCARQDNGTIVCTEMYCEKYNKPTCLDK